VHGPILLPATAAQQFIKWPLKLFMKMEGDVHVTTFLCK